jgi:hypothetical protein
VSATASAEPRGTTSDLVARSEFGNGLIERHRSIRLRTKVQRTLAEHVPSHAFDFPAIGSMVAPQVFP